MPISPGTLVANRYRIARLLGEGGFGAVYLAEDTRLGNKRVALKENFDRSIEAQKQFQLEAQLLANLEHTSLPRVTDNFIETDGRQFLIMDFIEGVDLHERVIAAGRPLSGREAATLMVQICEAVAYLHTRRPQIIHRDIKPPNIKITTGNRAVLVDFGIAKIYHPHKGTAKIAKAISPHFSPPEQYGGKTDARSDVYSLGATLYCLVSADLPPDAMDRLVKGISLVPPSNVNPAVNPALERIIMQSLELDPDRRFPNANRMVAALKIFLSGQTPSLDYAQSGGPRCPVCGWINRPGARFCSKDCTPLTGGSVPRQPVSPAPVTANMPPEVQFEMANAYARRDEFDQAVPLYWACLQAGYTDSAVFHNLAICLRLSDRASEGVDLLRKGTALYPRDADLQFQMALAYTSLDQMSKAARCASAACKFAPDDAAKQRLYGQCLFENKGYNEAIRQFNRVVRLEPGEAVNHIWLGRAYGEKGDLRRAAKTLQHAARLDRDDPDPLFWLGLFYYNNKRYADAVSSLTSALRRDPNQDFVQYLLGQSYLQQDQFKQALPYFRKAVALDPQDASYHFVLGLCYALLGRKSDARVSLQQALKIDPGLQNARDLLNKL